MTELKKAVTIGSNDLSDDGFDYLGQNTKYYLASKEGSGAENARLKLIN